MVLRNWDTGETQARETRRGTRSREVRMSKRASSATKSGRPTTTSALLQLLHIMIRWRSEADVTGIHTGLGRCSPKRASHPRSPGSTGWRSPRSPHTLETPGAPSAGPGVPESRITVQSVVQKARMPWRAASDRGLGGGPPSEATNTLSDPCGIGSTWDAEGHQSACEAYLGLPGL